MTIAHRDDACPFEWAEFNLPQELRPATKSVSPFARLVLGVGQAQLPAGSAFQSEVPSRSGSTLGSLLLPGLGFTLPKL